VPRPRLHVDGQRIARPSEFVEPNAPHTLNVGVDSGVMMTKEADTRLNLCEKHIQSCFADVAGPSTLPFETDIGWCIACQHDVCAARVRKPFNLIERVMPPGSTSRSGRESSHTKS